MSGTSKPHHPVSDQLPKLVGGAILLVMLDYGRDVLIPIVLAVFLSLLLAPLIRRLRHWGLGQPQAVAASVLLLFVTVSMTAGMLGTQAIKLASSLPKYESTIRNKLLTLDQFTLGKMNTMLGQADHLVSKLSPGPVSAPAQEAQSTQQQALPVRLEETHAKPFEIVSKVLETVLPPLEMAGIVLIVLIFILLDYESLRDRLIRLVSGGNFRATTQAITDATERLSRFFVSQFAVNVLVGGLVAAGLGVAGLSGALFWGALTAVSRFIPYIGIWLAAGAATIMAAAMSDGWTLMIATIGIYLFIEIVIAQFFEPRLYGHSTGLSPLSVVISAIFWSAIWGPVGLILSTPLTLCLVVAGRYVRALNFLEILLGDLSALSHAESFYQRALSGDSAELVRGLKKFLKDKPLRQYGDQVILTSIRLAHSDFSEHEITESERTRMNHSITVLIEAMSRKPRLLKNRVQGAVLDAACKPNPDSRRKTATAATRNAILVIHLGSHTIAEMVAKVMLNVLHSERMEARYLPPESLREIETGASIPLVFVACVAPEEHARELIDTLAELRRRLPDASLIVMRVLEEIEAPFARPSAAECGADALVHSYQDVVDSCYRLLAPRPAEAAVSGKPGRERR